MRHSDSHQRFDAAVRDDRIVMVPLSLVQRLYGLSYGRAKDAVEAAKSRLFPDRSRWSEIRAMIERDQRIETLRNAEESHPGLVALAVLLPTLAGAATRYGLTRSRVQQLRAAASALAEALHLSTDELGLRAVRGQLPATVEDEVRREADREDKFRRAKRRARRRLAAKTERTVTRQRVTSSPPANEPFDAATASKQLRHQLRQRLHRARTA